MSRISEKPIPTRYARALHEALLEEGYYNTLEEPVSVTAPDTSECLEYFADVWIPDLLVDVEIDGCHHQDEPQRSYDSRRETCMGANGIAVIRFTNQEVYEDLPGAVWSIKEFCSGCV